jgi:uncharacterized membrane protein YcaP (DUF421 family)
MNETFRVFDFHRIFLGDAPPLYLLEIVFRTLVMYAYTVFLLRLLGKRGMAQLSMLELAIIIAFGSAVGDPMIGADIPIFHGALAVTVVTLAQIGFERVINKNRKVEAVMEGVANLLVEDGIIRWECMKNDNLSKEDLFRSLRQKDVQHLGQVRKVFFETSGNISVFFQPPQKIKPGLSVEPEELKKNETVETLANIQEGIYSCTNCGYTVQLPADRQMDNCEVCGQQAWTPASSD